ncbi:hypothetical protein CR513_02978, partial [Mucuna pruriens]
MVKVVDHVQYNVTLHFLSTEKCLSKLTCLCPSVQFRYDKLKCTTSQSLVKEHYGGMHLSHGLE